MAKTKPKVAPKPKPYVAPRFGTNAAFIRLPPNPISLDQPPLNHPRGKDGCLPR